MANPNLSLDDLNRGFHGIEYLNLYLDYAMVLNVEYDGQPDNTLVSLMPEPQQEETRLIDACLAEHRDELSIRWLRCPQCGCTETDKQKTTCEECDRPLEAVRVATEESLRRKAWGRLRREIPGFQARSVVPHWLATDLYPGRGRPPDTRLELSLVFERILEGMRTTRDRWFRDSWDHLSLGKSVRELLPPRDETLDVKHYHYRAVGQKLIDGYKWLVIKERQHPDFIEADAQHRSLELFTPAVTLPKAPESQMPAVETTHPDATGDNEQAPDANYPPEEEVEIVPAPEYVITPPNVFQWKDSEPVELPPIQFLLLKHLLENNSEEVQDVADAVWGDKASETSGSTIASTQSKLNTRLTEAEIPISIATKSGYIVLSFDA